MPSLLLAAAVLLLMLDILWWIRVQRDVSGRIKTIKRLRTTQLYQSISPMLVRHRNDVVDSVTVHPTAITVRLLMPIGRESRYTFERHGLDQPEGETLYAVALAVAADLPALADTEHYRLSRHEDHLPDGTKREWYEYAILPRYRQDQLG